MDRLNPLRFKIHTYGCKVNTYDSGLLQQRLQKDGFELSNDPRVHILNTCAVTKEATREAVKNARRLKVKDPLALVVVTVVRRKSTPKNSPTFPALIWSWPIRIKVRSKI